MFALTFLSPLLILLPVRHWPPQLLPLKLNALNPEVAAMRSTVEYRDARARHVERALERAARRSTWLAWLLGLRAIHHGGATDDIADLLAAFECGAGCCSLLCCTMTLTGLDGEPRQVQRIGRCNALISIYRVPMMKRWHASLSNVLFAALFIWAIFSPLCGDIPPQQVAVAVFVAALWVQELHQFLREPLSWLGDWFNFLDVGLCVILALLCFLRYYRDALDEWQARRDVSVPLGLVDWFDTSVFKPGALRPGGRRRDDFAFYSRACDWSLGGELIASLIAISTVLLALRVFEVFTFSSDFARIWFSLHRMALDLFKMFWMITSLMFFFGIAFAVLAPNFVLDHSDGPLLPAGDYGFTFDLSAGAAIWQSFWSVFGYFDVAELSSSPSAAFLTPAFFYVYLYFVALPIVNLLIAMFSESFAEVTDNVARQRFQLRSVAQCLNYLHSYYPVPAPLNIAALPIVGVGAILKMVGGCLRRCCDCFRCGRSRTHHAASAGQGMRNTPGYAAHPIQPIPHRNPRTGAYGTLLSPRPLDARTFHEAMAAGRSAVSDEDAARDKYIESERERIDGLRRDANPPLAKSAARRQAGGAAGGSTGVGVGAEAAAHQRLEALVSAKLDELTKAMRASAVQDASSSACGSYQPGRARIVATNPVTGMPPVRVAGRQHERLPPVTAGTPSKGALAEQKPAAGAGALTPSHRVAPTMPPEQPAQVRVAVGAPLLSFARHGYPAPGARQVDGSS